MSRVFSNPWADSLQVSQVPENVWPEDRNGFIDVDLDRIAKWYWRVKRWRVDVSELSMSGGVSGGPPFEFYSHAADQVQQVVGGPQNEREIVLRSGGYEGSMDYEGLLKVYASFFVDPGVGVIALPGVTPGAIQRTPTGWRVKAGVAISSPDQELLSSVNLGIPSEATLSFDGIELPLYESIFGTVTWYGRVRVYPIEYWPYAQSDGSSPIWDAVTGEKLLDHRL